MLIRVIEKCSESLQVGCLVSLYGDGEKYLERVIFVSEREMKLEGLASSFSRLTPGEISENIKRINIFYLGTGFH